MLAGVVGSVQCCVRLPIRALTEEVATRAIRFQFVYSMVGLGVGLVCVSLGVILLLHGVSGATGWVVQLLGLRSSLSDAAPGVVLAVIGVVVIFVTRFDIRAEK
jgi:hypothetical protein